MNSDSEINTDSEMSNELTLDKNKVKRPLQLKIICLLLIIGASIHALILLGIMTEEGVPLVFTIYFNSLLILDILAAFGLWEFKKWGWYLIMYIAITQIISHGYLLIYYFQVNQVLDRVLDIAIVLYFLYYFNKQDIKSYYFQSSPNIQS